MSRIVKLAGGVLLWLVVAFCLAATLVPHFLDRIYYWGPVSGHFDGQRFFNPDGEDSFGTPRGGNRTGFFWRRLTGQGEAVWPDRVAVIPARPATRVGAPGSAGPMRATWVGHATVLVQVAGINILTDPIWAERTGPFALGPQRVTAPGIAFDDLPPIDLVLVSHNHYDHLDLSTLRRLWERDRPVIATALGLDSAIRQAGVPSRALDWGDGFDLRPGIRVHSVRSHHWTSRWLTDRNRALWSAFVVELPGGNLFFAGDTGVGDGEWPGEAAALGPIRLALIPIGAFRFSPGQMSTGSHIGPVEAVQVFDKLGQPFALPIHWGTFKLSSEARRTPPEMLRRLTECSGLDPARFAPRRIGLTIEVPFPTRRTGALDRRRLMQCADRPEIKRLP